MYKHIHQSQTITYHPFYKTSKHTEHRATAVAVAVARKWLSRFWTARRSIRILYNGPPLPPQNCPFPWGFWPQYNTWFLEPTRAQNANCISVGSVAHNCDRPTDRPTDHATRSVTIGRIYVRSTVMRPNNNSSDNTRNVEAALPNVGGALCSTPQSFVDAHY